MVRVFFSMYIEPGRLKGAGILGQRIKARSEAVCSSLGSPHKAWGQQEGTEGLNDQLRSMRLWGSH